MEKQLDISSRYNTVDVQKATGSHYTPSKLACFVAQQVCNLLPTTSSKIRILDPAIGDGELILAILDQLTVSQIAVEIVGFDTDREALKKAESRIKQHHLSASIDLRQVDFLEFAPQLVQQNLFNKVDFAPVDVVISNPPYVRTQVIGSEKSQELAKAFNLSGRVDLAFAFLKAIQWVMKPSALAGIIVSNRFLTTKAGATVRNSLQEGFHIHHIWDLGDTKLFDAAVLPAVLLLERSHKHNGRSVSLFSTIYSTDCAATLDNSFSHVLDALLFKGVVATSNGQRFEIQHGNLADTTSAKDVWRIATNETQAWLKEVNNHTFCTFGDLGKIRVGVKTTADKVFIRDDWQILGEENQPELLRPVITHHVGERFRAIVATKQKQILYTHEYRNGKRAVVNLEDYPKSASYLESNRSILEARKYVVKAKRNWYEIWVPQDPQKWILPKLVFRDIVDKPTFWIDFSGAIVNGDCYWMTLNSKYPEKFLWLALAVANSTFTEKFYDYRFNNKLYAGRRRYITQYVENFPIPDPESSIAEEIIETCQNIYKQSASLRRLTEEKQLDALIWTAFGV